MTVAWHVDDLKVSHKNPSKVTKFAFYLQSIYVDNLTVKHGKVTDYTRMNLDLF